MKRISSLNPLRSPIQLGSKTRNPKIVDHLVIEPKQGGPSSFVTTLVSDTHLDNHINSNRIHFRKWLATDLIEKEIEQTEKKEEIVLVILGDGIDFTASWLADFMPYDKKANISDASMVQKVITEIVSNNLTIFEELKRFLQESENTRIVYVVGNHDNVLLLDESFTDILSKAILPTDTNSGNGRLTFARQVEIPVLGLYAEHGHRFDSFNYSPIDGFNTGDWVIIKTNILFSKITDKVLKSSLPDEVKGKIVDKIKQMENIRPRTAIPIYLANLAKHYYEKYKALDIKAANEAKEIILSFSKEISELLEDIPFIKKLNGIGLYPKKLTNLLLGSKRIQILIGWIASLMEFYTTDNNKSQIEEAIKLSESNGIDFFSGGHTHILEHVRRNMHYFNLGAWKPLIPSYRKGYKWVFPESVLPAGSLRLETNLASKNRKRRVEYKFNTFEEGRVKLKSTS